MMRSHPMRQVFSRHPILSVFWIPPFALIFLLAFVFIHFSPTTQDMLHAIPFSDCQKSTGICTTYYITPFEHFLYLGMFVLAVPSFLIFWGLSAAESIRWVSTKNAESPKIRAIKRYDAATVEGTSTVSLHRGSISSRL